MAQFSRDGALFWNDRQDGQFIGCKQDADGGLVRTYDRPVYAVTPDDASYLSVSWQRLFQLRPAYGYAGGTAPEHFDKQPQDDGLWRVDLTTGCDTLILSVAEAATLLFDALPPEDVTRLQASNTTYWFNHVKINPSGTRVTVKLRWREEGRAFDGVSITCDLDGKNAHILARSTSHVMWWGDDHLFWWALRRKQVVLGADVPFADPATPRALAPDVLKRNPHARLVPNAPYKMIYDEPYTAKVRVNLFDFSTATSEPIAQFGGHIPEGGAFRCDLHPIPFTGGDKVLVTSLASGTRQVWLAERTR